MTSVNLREPLRGNSSPIAHNRNTERIDMSSPGAGSLTTDFDLMRGVAAKIDGRNDEIRTMLQGFIGRMTSVPPSHRSRPR